jgi:ribonuclease R
LAEFDLQHAILDFVNQPGYHPVKPRVIARHLRLDQDQVPEVRRAVKTLVRRGLLIYGARHLVMPIAPVEKVKTAKSKEAKPAREKANRDKPSRGKGNRLVGVFRRSEAGHGFVRPSGITPGDGAHDIYVAARESGDASTGDTVIVQLLPGRGRFPGPRGEIVEIVERQTHQFVGTYAELPDGAFVEVDGAVFSQPIYVGDPGASGVQPGDKVVIEMVRFPTHYRDGEGVITEILGPRGKPGVDTLSIIREFGLPGDFSEEVLEVARQESERFEEAVPPGRYDATHETVVTIDPVDARDFDDAISLEMTDEGHWRLGVHIADVSHFVRPGTPLDQEARRRATSVYLPDRVIPMLPEMISNALASLQPNKIRYTKSVYMEFTPEGVRVHSEFHSAAIKSHKRLTYEQVDEFLADREPFRKRWGVKVYDLLGRMHQLAMILRRRRFERGAIELNMPEVKVDLDKQGRVAGAHVVENTESHQIIEEFMLAANEAVAEMLRDKGLHFLRRVHKDPSPAKLKSLTEFVRELRFQVDRLESRFALQELLDRVRGRPEEHAVNYAVLRSFQRAVYSPEEEGHYALASDCYCHFTSPIRRYPDLTVHRLVESLLTGRKPQNDIDELLVLGEHCSERERLAESAERELVRVKLLDYLSSRIGEQMDAVVTGVERFGLFVQGVELPAEGLIHVDALVDDFYSYDRATHSLTGRRAGNMFRLGDLLRVAVARVDVDRRELDFRLIAHKRGPAPMPEAGAERPSRREKRGVKKLAKKRKSELPAPEPRRRKRR